jgi:arabinan endo-1,5-alpha-L-arabinosidase
MKIKSITLGLIISLSAGTFAVQGEDVYTNPVSTSSLPAPTIIKAADGYFYLYATEDHRNIPIYRSADLVNWSLRRTAFTEATRPDFESGGGLWAPDINYINGKYVLYYSMSIWGGEQTCGIGVATANSPNAYFTDKGKLFRSNEIGVQNSIDPFYIEDDGKKYLFWGSFRGIYAIELSSDGLSLRTGAEKQQVAGTRFEGTYIYKRGDYYYLFASIGSCCSGVNSTYQLVVGRSTSLLGLYANRSGNSMMNNNYTLVVESNDRFVGNGHCSEIVQDDAGNDWILFHGVDVNNPQGRVLLLNQLKWDDNDWPYIDGGAPALSAPKPVFGITGRETVAAPSKLNIYPNPVEQFAPINVNVQGKIRIYSMQGVCMDEQFVTNGTISTGRLPPGVYIIHAGEQKTKLIIKKETTK